MLLRRVVLAGKLSFNDNRSRVLETGDIVVWGVLEVGRDRAGRLRCRSQWVSPGV